MRLPGLMTYIYPKGTGCVHINTGYGGIGKEHGHDDPNWQPPNDWPYPIKDMRGQEGDNNEQSQV